VTEPASPDPPSSPAPGVENDEIGPEIATGGMGSVLEVRVLAMPAHPNIVPIHDIVWEDGMPLFHTMTRVKGRTLLREEVARTVLTPEEIPGELASLHGVLAER
jgi:hypothetical protein